MQNITLKKNIKDWTPNIANLSERLIMGPQREVLSKLHEINNRYGLSLGITKTYRWSPGYMDQVKKWVNDSYVQPHKKRPLTTFFNQIDEKQWSYRNLKEKLIALQYKMKDMRNTYNCFQDNTETVQIAVEAFKARLDKELQGMESMVDVFIGEYSDDNNDMYGDIYNKEMLIIRVFLPAEDMNLMTGSTVHKVPINESFLYWSMDLDELIYKICYDTKWVEDDTLTVLGNPRYSTVGYNNNPFNGQWKGRYYKDYINDVEDRWGGKQLLHPYISSEEYKRAITCVTETDDHTDLIAYICLGDFQIAIHDSLKKLKFNEVYAIFMRWHTTFNATATSPMNTFSTLWFGRPEFVTDELAKIYPSMMDRCRIASNSTSGPTGYCDDYKCQYRDKCSYYLQDSNEVADQDSESFEVVDSDADNIHGGEYAQTHTAGRDDSWMDPHHGSDEAEIEEIIRINRENGLTDDGEIEEETALDYAEEMDRINNLPLEDVPDPELTIEERVIQWAAQQGGALNILERNNDE